MKVARVTLSDRAAANIYADESGPEIERIVESIFAEEIGLRTTSAAAGAIWFPYDAGPAAQAIAWALETYRILQDLAHDSRSGVSMIEQRIYSRSGEIKIPDWAAPLGARRLRATHSPRQSVHRRAADP